MKVMTLCTACHQAAGIPRFSSAEFLELPEEGLIEMTCDLGHRTGAVVQNEKYDILAQMAVEAIVGGHHNAAVSLFAAALERLYEHCFAIICRTRNVDANVFQRAWKSLASQSERQFGAFAGAFLLDAGTEAPSLPRRAVELRNKVTHGGYIASRAEALAFGQAVADCAHPILNLLGNERHSQTVIAATFDLLRARGGDARRNGVLVSTVALAAVLERKTGPLPVSIAAVVADFTARPDFVQAVVESRKLGQVIDQFMASKAAGRGDEQGGDGRS